ncbi:transcriptional regulator [Paenibacillus sp. N1-5-1-14]|uniref:BTAD domain-containing putative transcriptional regulator n=1 Tax=Paenibacillus radicibacter TaxID=2972488 RepID=UPI0021591DC6|nr:BTAD domain-containing putative transcriptional regulator [Paenibacillus radicibacter]MCR8644164.1 transcriptional regulator [Paenibacillus radicibacter]
MKTENMILMTKLAAPHLKKHMLRRSILTKKLKCIEEYPVTLVHSGPGYGKSTALSAFVHTENITYCWYSASAQDDDLVPFLHYVIYAIRKQFNEFGSDLLTRMRLGEQFTQEKEIHTLCEAFINELLTIKQELVFIIDDLHFIMHSTAINRFMHKWLSHMPSNFHLVLSSRTLPKWDLLTSMAIRGDLLEIREKDFAFSEEEIEVLFTDNYEFALRPDEARRIYQKTEGWVIAIQLIWQRLLLTGGSVQAVLGASTETMEGLFRFLALEVFQKLSPEMNQFMLETSILEELTGELCDQIFDRSESHALLNQVSSQNLFLVSLGNGQFRYHALFKEFLHDELRKHKQEYIELHRVAARYYERNGKQDQAIYHLDAIGDDYALAQVLQTYGRQMIDHGQLESLLQRVKNIPERLKTQFYMLWIYEGEIHRYRCAFEQSLTCYCKGEEVAAKYSDSFVRSLALEGQARIYLDTIQPGKAEALLEKSISILEQEDQPMHEHLLRLYGLMAENLVNSGRAAQAELWYARCRELNSNFQDEQLEARMHLRTGRLRQAKKVLERISRLELQLGKKQLSRSHREINLLLALVEAMVGDAEAAKQLAESGMMQGIELKAPFVEACGWMRMGHAAQLMPKYTFSIAHNCYRTSQDMMEQLDVSRGKAEPLMGLCLLFGREGLMEQALQYGKEALVETMKVNDDWLSALIRTSLGVSLFYARKLSEALAMFQECQEQFVRVGDSYGVTVSLLWQSMIAYQMESSTESFGKVMGAFLRMMQAGEYDFLIEKRTLFGPTDIQQIVPLLIEAQRLDIQSHYVSYLFNQLGLEHMTYHPGYTLRIDTLGQFRVWLGDRELIEKDWQRGKAKELFQLLLIKRQRLVTKDEILSLLFSNMDEKSANRDFKVALNALNTALEPNRQARVNPFFIQRQASSYGLNIAAGLILDSVDFENLMKAGLEEQRDDRAIRYLEKGLELYLGDFLPDRRFEDWCIEERERLLVFFLRGAERLAKLLVKIRQYDRAIHWCEQMLLKDSCWEEAYRLLMQCHYQMNNRNQAMKWYHKCCQVLGDELGIEPMPITKQLYLLLMQTDVTHL